MAYCRRFLTRMKEKHIGVGEYQKAKLLVFKMVQNECLKDVLECLKSNKPVRSDVYKRLSPFVDDDGLVRLRGRLKHSGLHYDRRHPILLIAKHPAVAFFIEWAHRQNSNEGTEFVRSVLQQEFWILGLRNALRRVKARCVICRKRDAQPMQPLMADLPRDRESMGQKPFATTGVDYFGPLEVKLLRRTMKRWCCMFTCLVTRAVHIEVVKSLDTEACLAAITRFIARRGRPATMISDNGTNFVGAAKELKQFMGEWDKLQIETTLAQKEIVWKFNPPGSPHFGGVWERMVRSCKRSMWAVLGSRNLTDEILTTTMCLVEQTLNARPLTCVSNDPDDLEALTPNHFLLGDPNVAVPFLPNAERYSDLRKMFKTSQCYADMIWKRWTTEYLPTWNSRQK